MSHSNVNTDQTLVHAGAAACGTQKRLAARCGCSERVISEVARGKRALPTTLLPGAGKTAAELIQAAIDAKGNVPEVHRGPGRTMSLTARHFYLEVPSATARRFRRAGGDISAAIGAYLSTYPSRAAAPAMPPPPGPRTKVVAVKIDLTTEASAAMAGHLDGRVELRSAFLRAVVAHALGRPAAQPVASAA